MVATRANPRAGLWNAALSASSASAETTTSRRGCSHSRWRSRARPAQVNSCGALLLLLVLALSAAPSALGLIIRGAGPLQDDFYGLLAAQYAFDRDDISLSYQVPRDTCEAMRLYDRGVVDFFTVSYPLREGACSAPAYNGSAFVQVPMAGMALALPYRLDALPLGTDLVLNGTALAGIVAGSIATWDHPVIRQLNPSLAYSGPVRLYFALADATPGNIGDALVSALRSMEPSFGPWFDAQGANLTTILGAFASLVDDPVASINATDGAIGYALLQRVAAADGLRHASMINRAGVTVRASVSSVAAAVTAVGDANVVSIVNAPGAGSWPLSSLALAVMRVNRQRTTYNVDCLFVREALNFLGWAQINNAASGVGPSVGYAGISFIYKRTATNLVQTVLCNGATNIGRGIVIGNGAPNDVYYSLTQGYSSTTSAYTLKYFGTTTAGGIAALRSGAADFAVISTALPAADQADMPSVKPVPITAMAIAPIYNIPAIKDLEPMVLSMQVLADIHLAHVTRWNDPAIVALNPHLVGALPDANITIVYQTTYSAITYIYSKALAQVVPEFGAVVGFGNTITFPAANRSIGIASIDVMQAVQRTPNSFALWTSNYASLEREANTARMVNRDGVVVTVNQTSMAAAVEALVATTPVEIFWAPGAGSWPVLSLNSLLLDTRQEGECARLEVIVDWLYWSQTSRQAFDMIVASGLGMPSVSRVVISMLLDYIADVRCDGRPVSPLAACISRGQLCSGVGDCVQGACRCESGRAGTLCEGYAQSDGSGVDTTMVALLASVLPLGALLALAAFVLLLIAIAHQRRRRRLANADWEIPFAELEMGAQLGAGGYGTVFRARWRGTDVAVKLIAAPTGAAALSGVVTRTLEARFREEANVMATLRHPNVVLFMAGCTKPPNMCIVMEYMALGSLNDLLHNDLIPEIPFGLKVKIMGQTAKGMHFLHSSGIVHRDLKSLNLLLDAKWNVKVADFGLTRFKEELKRDRTGGTEIQGTVHWTAPEVLEDQSDIDHAKADVYSFGVVVWELFTREQPYENMSPAQIAVAVIRDQARPWTFTASSFMDCDHGALSHGGARPSPTLPSPLVHSLRALPHWRGTAPIHARAKIDGGANNGASVGASPAERAADNGGGNRVQAEARGWAEDVAAIRSDGEREAAALVRECCHADASIRPTFLEIMQRVNSITGGDTSSGRASKTSTSDFDGSSSSSSATSTSAYSTNGVAAAIAASKAHASSRTHTGQLGLASNDSNARRKGKQSDSQMAAAECGPADAAAPDDQRQRPAALLRINGVAKVPRRNVSFVVCDLAALNELWVKKPELAAHAVGTYTALVRREASARGGHIFSWAHLHSGGTCMVSFHELQGALEFALSLHRNLVALAASDPTLHDELTSRSRIGISTQDGDCTPPADDPLKFGYDELHYSDACLACIHCSPGRIECTDLVVQRVVQERIPARLISATPYARLVAHEDPAVDCNLDNADAAIDKDDDMSDDDNTADDNCGHGSDAHYSDPWRSGKHSGRHAHLSKGALAAGARNLCSSNMCGFIINHQLLTVYEDDCLGEGAYGRVCAGSYRQRPVAVKTLASNRNDDAAMIAMRKEAAILSGLSHPNIVQPIGLCISPSNTCLVMELVPDGNLKSLLAAPGKLKYGAKMGMLRDAALGIAYLHQCGLVHRDIKPSNLLIERIGMGKAYTVKVADFGFVTDNEHVTKRCGSPAWMAPELLQPQPRGTHYDTKVDVYSFGIVMWQVLTQKEPYAINGASRALLDLATAIIGGERPPIPTDCPKPLADLMALCWHRKPRKRPAMVDLVIFFNRELESNV